METTINRKEYRRNDHQGEERQKTLILQEEKVNEKQGLCTTINMMMVLLAVLLLKYFRL